MDKNTVIYQDYPFNMEVGLPAKWIFVAEHLLNEEQYKDWLFNAMQYFGFCGMKYADNSNVNMILRATYDEDEEFFDRYYNMISHSNLPIEDKLKVNRAWSREKQLDDYLNR